MPFLTALALLFIGLKLAGFLAWPWAFVLAPIWIPIAVLGVSVFTLSAVAMLNRQR